MPHRKSLAALDAPAELFAALGDTTRLRVLFRLSQEGRLSVSALTEGARVSRQAVTKHLEVLEDAGVVRSSKAGRARVWQLEPRRLAEAKKHLDTISRQWDESLVRLRSLVDDG
ncbi:MAG: metalloregulator ArsR/SmtB family transcription factor [Polyangiaceae bacterium]